MDFTIKQTNKEDEYHRKAAKSDTDSEPETWEKMQISKAINNQQVSASFSFHLEIASSVSMLGVLLKTCLLMDDWMIHTMMR